MTNKILVRELRLGDQFTSEEYEGVFTLGRQDRCGYHEAYKEGSDKTHWFSPADSVEAVHPESSA